VISVVIFSTLSNCEPLLFELQEANTQAALGAVPCLSSPKEKRTNKTTRFVSDKVAAV
jgi:hypothetical protein